MSDRTIQLLFHPGRFLAWVLTTLLLAVGPIGCVSWSKDVAAYRKVLDDQQPSTRPSFDSKDALTLVHALQLANADNESIGSRGEDYIQALAEKMRQAGTFLPTISLDPSYSWTHNNKSNSSSTVVSTGTVTTINTSSGTSHQLSVPLNASATGSLSNASSLQAAARTAERQAQLLLDERETILLDVVQSYYTALKAEHQASVYQHSVELKAEKVRDQQQRLKLGNVRPLDLAQSESDLAGTRASLTQSRTDAANARSALARLIGVNSVDGPLSDAFVPAADLEPPEVWQARALRTRQDLLAAARYRESAKYSLDSAIRQYFPSVTVNFEYFLYNNPSSITTWSNVISANIPVFSALSIEADIRKAWSLYRQAGLSEMQTSRQVVDDVNENYQSLAGSRLRVADLQIEVDAAQRAYDLSERSYQLGSISNLDRLTQQDNLLTAQVNLVSEQFNEKSDYLGLLRASGQLSSVLHSPKQQ